MIDLNDLLQFFQPSFIVKFGLLFAEFFLIVFLVVVWRQVTSMNEIVTDANDATLIKSFAVILLVIAVSLFIATIVIL